MFAGKECARALALMSTNVEDCNGRVADLDPEKKAILRDWQRKFLGKYPVVGAIEVCLCTCPFCPRRALAAWGRSRRSAVHTKSAASTSLLQRGSLQNCPVQPQLSPNKGAQPRRNATSCQSARRSRLKPGALSDNTHYSL